MTFESLILSINPQYAKHMKQQTLIETITPRIASSYLEFNNNNRPLRKAHIRSLAFDMMNGDWQVTHQGIAFDTTGRLIDGQHRLHAIIEAGVPIQMLVTRGCSASSFSILDRGANRSPSDILGWPKKITEVIMLAVRIASGTNPTVSRIKLMEQSRLVENCQILLHHCQTCRSTMSSSGVKLAACVQMTEQKDHQFVISQYRALISQQYNDMTKCSQSFNRQARDKHMPREELFCRAMFVFDNLEVNRPHIIITEDTIAQKNEILRRIVKNDTSGYIGNEA
jgi:hypothetical protein